MRDRRMRETFRFIISISLRGRSPARCSVDVEFLRVFKRHSLSFSTAYSLARDG